MICRRRKPTTLCIKRSFCTHLGENQKYMMRLWICFVVCIGLTTCKPIDEGYKEKAKDPAALHQTMQRMVEILRHDIFAPPIAARIMSYASVAGYEAMLPSYLDYRSVAGQLHDLTPAPQPDPAKVYCFELSSASAMLFVAKQLVFSESGVEDKKEEVFDAYLKMGMPKDVYQRSIEYGETVGKHVMAWSKKDRYAQTRSASRYQINLDDAARWVPTPPQYDDALEPHWATIRNYTLDSATQFLAPQPVPFSDKKGSPFYKSAIEVHEICLNATPDQKATGLYWDDNPFQVTVSGHLKIGKKKISPGAHWMKIAGYACRKAGVDFAKTAEVYMKTSISLHDAFVSCWASKYTYNVVRPETFINKYVDSEWRPFIETPPFPEYTSGHATISAAAATVLTDALGVSFSFTDSTEVIFEQGARTYLSFMEAANESALSRVYAGIHYRSGSEQGLAVGQKVGAHVLSRVKTKK
jgi:PAP2 superfamily